MFDRWPLRRKCLPSPPNFSPCRNGHWPSRIAYSRETAACRAKNNQCWNKGLLKERVTLLQIGWHVLTNHRSLGYSPSLSYPLQSKGYVPSSPSWVGAFLFESLCSIVSRCYHPLHWPHSFPLALPGRPWQPLHLRLVLSSLGLGRHGNILSRFHHQGQGEVLNHMSSLARWLHTHLQPRSLWTWIALETPWNNILLYLLC